MAHEPLVTEQSTEADELRKEIRHLRIEVASMSRSDPDSAAAATRLAAAMHRLEALFPPAR